MKSAAVAKFRRRRWRAAALVCWLAWLAPTAALARPSIWFGADDPWVRAWKHRAPNDFMDLFTGDDAWAKNVDVLSLSMQFVFNGREDQLKTIIDFAQKHRLKVAMVGLMLAKHPNCGEGIEGYSGPHGVERTAQRFRQLGGHLDYLVMDEPLYFGSVYPLGDACQTPIPDLAAEIAERVRQVRAIYPSVAIGEDEVAGLADKFHWVATLAQWFDAYRSAVGAPLAFIHLDVGWQSPRWPGHVQAIAALAHKDGIKFGVDYTGSPNDPDDATWSRHSREHAWQIEHELGVHPDQGEITSWMPHPNAILPPSDPSTLTGVLRCYVLMEQASGEYDRACR